MEKKLKWASGFTAKFLTLSGVILWSYRLQKQPSICLLVVVFFYNNIEKIRAELALFSVEKGRALHLTLFVLSVLLETTTTSQSARDNFDSNCESFFRSAPTLD